MGIRIMIADDHEVVRRGMKSLLQSHEGWDVCGEATNGREVIDRAKTLAPDVIVLDITMPELGGLEAARQILRALPKIEILVLTMHDSEELIREVFEVGARGYMVKTDTGRDLIRAVEAVSEHKPFFTSKVAEMVLSGYLGKRQPDRPQVRPGSLTSRELEVIHLMADGRSNKEVASLLGISAKTAEAHRINIMRKLQVHSVAEVVRYAVRNQLLQP